MLPLCAKYGALLMLLPSELPKQDLHLAPYIWR